MNNVCNDGTEDRSENVDNIQYNVVSNDNNDADDDDDDDDDNDDEGAEDNNGEDVLKLIMIITMLTRS